jgi:hypothetical protein
MRGRPELSIIVPVYNEAEALPALYARVAALLDRLEAETEVILVDDGSRDASYAAMLGLRRKDPRFKLVRFSRNFGTLLRAGVPIELARGTGTAGRKWRAVGLARRTQTTLRTGTALLLAASHETGWQCSGRRHVIARIPRAGIDGARVHRTPIERRCGWIAHGLS